MGWENKMQKCLESCFEVIFRSAKIRYTKGLGWSINMYGYSMYRELVKHTAYTIGMQYLKSVSWYPDV